MNPKDLDILVKFRSALISELPVDSIFDTELDFDDMSKIMEIINKVNTALSSHQIPITESTTMNATMYDPNDVAFKQDKPVAKQFSKLDVLAGYTNDLRDDEPSRTQAIEQPISRDSLLPAYPPTPQNSSYRTDLINAQAQVPMLRNIVAEVSPWEAGDIQEYAQNPVPLPDISHLPPEVQAWYRDLVRYGNPEMFMQAMGLIQ